MRNGVIARPLVDGGDISGRDGIEFRTQRVPFGFEVGKALERTCRDRRSGVVDDVERPQSFASTKIEQPMRRVLLGSNSSGDRQTHQSSRERACGTPRLKCAQ